MQWSSEQISNPRLEICQHTSPARKQVWDFKSKVGLYVTSQMANVVQIFNSVSSITDNVVKGDFLQFGHESHCGWPKHNLSCIWRDHSSSEWSSFDSKSRPFQLQRNQSESWVGSKWDIHTLRFFKMKKFLLFFWLRILGSYSRTFQSAQADSNNFCLLCFETLFGLVSKQSCILSPEKSGAPLRQSMH